MSRLLGHLTEEKRQKRKDVRAVASGQKVFIYSLRVTVTTTVAASGLYSR